jgi:hypothetical protein
MPTIATTTTTIAPTTTTVAINCSGLQLLSNDWGGTPPMSYMYLTLNSVYAADECYPATVTVRYYSNGARTLEYPSSSQVYSMTYAGQPYSHVCPSGASGAVYWRAVATRTAPFSYGSWSAGAYGANSITC